MESISETDFNGKILIISNFSRTDCEHSKFNRTSLLQADFSEADFRKAKFRIRYLTTQLYSELISQMVISSIPYSI